MHRQCLGVITGGTFNDGLIVRLDEATSSEDVQIGDFCVIEGDDNLYFSMIQDLRLEATDQRLMAAPPPNLSPFMRRALRGTSTYVVAEVKPMLMVKRLEKMAPETVEDEGGPQPVRTIPMHFAQLAQASAKDFATVFGQDNRSGNHFAMGRPLTMEAEIPINLRRLVERSSGVFGSTGTGKSFLTRILLCGVIVRKAAVNLIFDMHNEYAYGKDSEEGERVKGLKELFGPQVMVYTLDKTNRRADHDLAIGLDEIETGDVLSLSRELGLSSSTADVNLSMLQRRFHRTWLRDFINLNSEELAALSDEIGGHLGSLQALHRRLRRLRDRDYIHEHVTKDVFAEMIRYLDKGKHIILHFGRHDDVLDQMIVANMVTRRIRELYREKTEKYQLSGKPGDKPQPLVITIEEAHRFLNPEMARQTIFGTIARELRKYYVTLLIVDQRPSGIDDEILSQVGTRVSGKLMDDRDLEAVLSGVANRAAIRAGLASLDTKQQVMIFGHAVPMPIALRTRLYDNAFYQAVTNSGHTPKDNILDLYAPDGKGQQGNPQKSSKLDGTSHDSFEEEVDLLFGEK
ncbi:MAG: ATP-binding protein [Chloroflexota bacterium]|nr:ATP-binding protein [Chloroflexota bacterium]